VLVELGVVEQRYRAVLEVLEEGTPVIEVARRYGVARQTVHQWLRRYANEGGLGGLADRSSRPQACPHQMPAEVEARIVGLRRAHPSWGPSRIVWQLGQQGTDPLPGRSSVYRALVRHGLVEARKRRRRREDYRRWERGRAMELWQMDVMGRVFLTSGEEVKVVTGIDDHSRFIVCAKIVLRATARPVCLALTEALRRHGYDVATYANRADAIKSFRTRLPDLALVDIGLPQRDGYELARDIRSRIEGREVFLVAVTGYGQPEDHGRAMDAGFDAHLVKPVDPDRLAALIASALRRS
jgi:CheY-like chemotaxis protein/transposase